MCCAEGRTTLPWCLNWQICGKLDFFFPFLVFFRVMFYFGFISGACLWTGNLDAAAVQLLPVPSERFIKWNAFWQFLSFHLNVVPNPFFFLFAMLKVKHRMRARSNRTSPPVSPFEMYGAIQDPHGWRFSAGKMFDHGWSGAMKQISTHC